MPTVMVIVRIYYTTKKYSAISLLHNTIRATSTQKNVAETPRAKQTHKTAHYNGAIALW